MGNEQPKKGYQPKLQKQQLEISCIKVIGHLELQRDRRMNQGMQKEKVLISMINSPQRSKVDEVHKASSIVSDMNYINGCNIVIRYCNIIKDRSMLICESIGKPDNIKELLPFIESVIWAAKHLNLNALSEFQNIMLNFFGAQGIDVTSSPQIDPELKKCFETVMPSPEDINAYVVKLSEKTGIPLQQINQAGHEFYNPQTKQQQQQQNNNSNNNNNNNNGQGPNVGGYFPPSNQGGFGGGGGNVFNINVQLPPQSQYYNPNQQQQQNQFGQPQSQQEQQGHQQQGWNQQPQWNQPPGSNQGSQQQQWNQQQPNNYSNNSFDNNSNNSNNSNQFSQQQQQQSQQSNSQQQHQYPGFGSNTIQQQQYQPQSQPLQQPQQQQYFQNNHFPVGQSTYPNQQPGNQVNQPPQQGGFNQPPQQNQFDNNNSQQPLSDDGLDSLEARLKRIREGV